MAPPRTRGVYVEHQQRVRPGINDDRVFIKEWNRKTAAQRRALVNALHRVEGERNIARNQRALANNNWFVFYALWNAPAPNLDVFNAAGRNAILEYQNLRQVELNLRQAWLDLHNLEQGQ